MSLSAYATREQIATDLQHLMAHRGFRHLPMNKFEEYDVYVDNKNFLATDHIVTFTDTTGKLLALKPDNTISIAKRLPNHAFPGFQKFFYRDEVLRFSKENREYHMLDQIGIEIMGDIDMFANIELVDLALESLSIISQQYVLDLSHNGFIHGLLEAAGLGYRGQKRVLTAIHSKSPHSVQLVLTEEAVDSRYHEAILSLLSLTGPFASTLTKAKSLVANKQMEHAYEELRELADALRTHPNREQVQLDFSAVGDLDYYNGIVLVGYVKECPQEVLTGGRYDKLLQRMRKQSGAVGFAIALSQLPCQPAPSEYDFDCLIYYTADADTAALLEASKQLTTQGLRVRCEPQAAEGNPLDFTYQMLYYFDKTLTKGENPTC